MDSKKSIYWGKWIVAIFITCALIIWAELSLGWASLLVLWQAVPMQVILMAGLMTLFSHLLRGLRLVHAYHQLLLPIKLNALKVIAVSWIHNAANFILPMRLGEIVLPALSRFQLNVPIKESVSSLIGIRLFDLHVLLVLVLLFQRQLPSALQVTLIGLLMFGLVILPYCQKLPFIHRFYPCQFLTLSTLSISYLLSLLIWVVKLTAFYWIFSYFIQLEFFSSVLGILLADLSSTLPINGLASAGSYEAAFSLGLMINEPQVQEVLAPIINLHLFLLLSNILIALLGISILIIKSRF